MSDHMKPIMHDHVIPPCTYRIPPGESFVVCGPPVDTRSYAYLRSVILLGNVVGSLRLDWGLSESGSQELDSFTPVKEACVVDGIDGEEHGISMNVIKLGGNVGRERFMRARLEFSEIRQTPTTPLTGLSVSFAAYMELYRPNSPMAATYDAALRATAPASMLLRNRFEAG